MKYGDLDMTQISDGLTQTAACASAAVYDKENGLMFVSYKTGLPKRYGESTGRICLSVFPPSQPHNIRHRILDMGVGQSRGVLCTAHYLVGDARTRIIFSTPGTPGGVPADGSGGRAAEQYHLPGLSGCPGTDGGQRHGAHHQ